MGPSSHKIFSMNQVNHSLNDYPGTRTTSLTAGIAWLAWIKLCVLVEYAKRVRHKWCIIHQIIGIKSCFVGRVWGLFRRVIKAARKAAIPPSMVGGPSLQGLRNWWRDWPSGDQSRGEEDLSNCGIWNTERWPIPAIHPTQPPNQSTRVR